MKKERRVSAPDKEVIFYRCHSLTYRYYSFNNCLRCICSWKFCTNCNWIFDR